MSILQVPPSQFLSNSVSPSTLPIESIIVDYVVESSAAIQRQIAQQT